ncbi:nicotinate (nicotinamide) nucleotide adenylyltransferase [Coraliomargarita akajimensis]|uniref:Probable nicotinate-nucleotide adenylyltransferase n=1 Tax=Coraliomargarita akajimensis (strain DSM 45221 / IAM 15411 / JCM 23193 / KCTC 12865 / 04OKA010-24) TaxID=583355 RepID=D5EJ40_CORAD|nr:nicotinate (nicotinamide) nucleotide adenylyltransferase [Coraliomargarita akajimensis]ADE54439.1 nicotinate (nicotinamide) nucleotide adenylyltransferase [Coraliomargarita akajimensis DSM 45221]
MKTENPPSQIALYGGSFDPVHCAHVRLARRALEQTGIDEVRFLPASRSPLKAHSVVASNVQRLAMLKLALKGESGMSVDPYELEKGGTSYTVETVRHFKAALPGTRLSWILGADQFEMLADWYAIEELASMVDFLVFARPGYRLKPPMVEGLRFAIVESEVLEVSSSSIRARLSCGQSAEAWLHPAVEAFICENELYM